MKRIIVLFTICIICISQAQAQGDILFGVGLIYGSNVYNNLTLFGKQNADTQIASERRNRYGISFSYTPNEFFYIKTGIEIAKRGYTLTSGQLADPINYEFTYLHIPMTSSFELVYLDDLFDGGVFFAPEYGFGIDVMMSESIGMQPADAGFSKINLVAKLGSNIGVKLNYFRIYLNPTIQCTLRPAVNNNSYINTARGLYFSAQLHAEYYF